MARRTEACQHGPMAWPARRVESRRSRRPYGARTRRPDEGQRARGPGRTPLGFPRWLAAAASLHLGALFVATRVLPPAASDVPEGRPAPAPPAREGAWLWLDEPPSPGAEDPRAGVAPPSTRAAAAARPAPVTRGAPSERSAQPASKPGATASVSPEPLQRESSEASVTSPESSPAGSGRPALSLAELGVGSGNNPFVRELPEQPSEQQHYSRRLQGSLRASLAREDAERGLGPEGPATRALVALVMDSAAAPNTEARLAVHTDAAGRTVSVELLDASSDSAEWERVAAALKRALAERPLRIPAGSSGMRLELLVSSREQLPSGADPGFAVELFGATLKEGAGPRSSRLSLLTPKIMIQELQVPYTDGRSTMTTFAVVPSIIAFSGDVVDIGAAARRVVSARLVQLDVHSPMDSAAARP